REKGTDFVWDELLAHPPARTSMLFRPQTYAPQVDIPPRYAAAFANVPEALTKNKPWSVINTTLGEMELRGDAVFSDSGQLEEILAHLEYGQKINAFLDDREAEVRLLDFSDASWANRYLELLRQENLDQTKDLAASIGMAVEIRFEDFDDVEADTALKRVQSIPSLSGLSGETEAVWVVRGDLVVVVVANKFRPGIRTGRAVNLVFDNFVN
ncbi:MAG: hypothetical protein HN348_35055, partial [Proteobacteria bacterium]|nr:hypothetical protein [Pseudomonadota bacterium]